MTIGTSTKAFFKYAFPLTVVAIFSTTANAGTQHIIPIELRSMRLATQSAASLMFEGNLPNGSAIEGIADSTEILGAVSLDRHCSKYECTATFMSVGNNLIAEIDIDRDQDGNPEDHIALIIGKLQPGGQVEFAPKAIPRAKLVQDRYSFLEKLSGAKDRDYFSITILLEE